MIEKEVNRLRNFDTWIDKEEPEISAETKMNQL